MFRYLILVTGMLLTLQLSSGIAGADSTRMEEMERRIEALSGEVAQLRSSVDLLESLRPTTMMLMPSISERFYVMRYAANAGDWDLAANELSGIEQLFDMVGRVDPEKGTLVERFMLPQLAHLDAAIDRADHAAFAAAMEQTVDSCNACHVAAGSPSMVVVLDAVNAISLRHPHRLAPAD